MSWKDLVYVRDLARHVGAEVTLRGWLDKKRSSGKIRFLVLRDGTGSCQCIVMKNGVDEATWNNADSLTQESSFSITGSVRAEQRAPGGFELDVRSVVPIQIATDYPISPKEHGAEFLIEHRHLWLRSSRQHAIMRVRARVVKAIRDFFDNNGFVLMDSPMFTPSACEGTSTLFETEYFDLGKAYLSQSGQLYAEASAMAHGKVYTFGPVFRAEKSKTRKHLTEFWMVEPEMAWFDLNDDMDLAEEFVEYIVQSCLNDCRDDLVLLERDIEKLEKIKRPFYRMSYTEAVERLAEKKVPLTKKLPGGEEQQIIPFPWGEDLGSPQEDALMEDFDKPVIIHRYPAAIKAFYMKRDPNDPRVVMAMDMLAPEGGGEIIGGSQREDSHDALLERIRHENLPEQDFQWYLDLRKYGSVPHAGFGLGLERTVKWITGAQHIREVIPFPRMIYRITP
jgi:asparaginyl-tRNA synthetase